jgi:hypothetical protein
MKKNYDVAREGHYLHARIGFEKPMGAFTTRFFMPGPQVPNLPRIAASRSYMNRIEPCVALAGSAVPFVYTRNSYVQFGVAHWGPDRPTGKNSDYFRNAETRGLGFAGMIPASFVDLAVDPENAADGAITVRLRPTLGDTLFIGCKYLANNLNEAASVTMLVSEPGPDIAPYADWQPIIIPVSLMPRTANSDFLFGRDRGRLQVPSAQGLVKIERLCT